MNALNRLIFSVIVVIPCTLATTLRAANYDAILEAMRASDYQSAERLALTQLKREKHDAFLWSVAGDCAFFRADPVAYTRYTNAWLETMDRAYKDTKGDSKFWQVFAVGAAVLGAVADTKNAKQGITSTHFKDATDIGIDFVGTLEEATGNPNYRKSIKGVISDLRKISKRKTSSFQIIKPVSSMYPGAGMVRVHVGAKMCPAVRSEQAGSYVTAATCFDSAAMQMREKDKIILSMDSSLMPSDSAQADSIGSSGLWHWITVMPGKDNISSSTFRPTPTLDNGETPVAFGATWFAEEFGYVIPVFQECSSAQFNDCGNIDVNNALLWGKLSDGWHFYGFSAPDGKAIRYDPSLAVFPYSRPVDNIPPSKSNGAG